MSQGTTVRLEGGPVDGQVIDNYRGGSVLIHYDDGLLSAQAYIAVARRAAQDARRTIGTYGRQDWHRRRALGALDIAIEQCNQAMRETNYELDAVRRESGRAGYPSPEESNPPPSPDNPGSTSDEG